MVGEGLGAAGVNEMVKAEAVDGFVLDEAITLLARRTDYAFAAERAERMYSSRALEILRPGPEEELAALCSVQAREAVAEGGIDLVTYESL